MKKMTEKEMKEYLESKGYKVEEPTQSGKLYGDPLVEID